VRELPGEYLPPNRSAITAPPSLRPADGNINHQRQQQHKRARFQTLGRHSASTPHIGNP
jgi:hypothetical protein